ncbi:MAG: hypothetical protein CM15mP18_0820 [Methanobacteriota archaeon]|nr:MAG: hypothetical protein CM15mP18_0820 [Euryarchaeota archaeon]
MLELDGTPQDIVDYRRKHVPALVMHACPMCNEGNGSTPVPRRGPP